MGVGVRNIIGEVVAVGVADGRIGSGDTIKMVFTGVGEGELNTALEKVTALYITIVNVRIDIRTSTTPIIILLLRIINYYLTFYHHF